MTARALARFGASLLVAALAASSVARADDQTVIRELTAASAVRPELRVVDGFPRAVRVDVRTSGPTPEARARDYLARFAALYRLTDPSAELVLDRTASAGGLESVFFVQRHQGYRVAGGELAVHLSGDRVVLTNGHLAPDLGPVPAPRLAAADARRLAFAASGLGAPEPVGHPALVVRRVEGRTGTSTRPAWEVHLAGRGRGGAEEVTLAIDAVDGSVLARAAASRDLSLLVMDAANASQPSGCWDLPQLTPWFTEDGPTVAYDPALDPIGDGAGAFDHTLTTHGWFEGLNQPGWGAIDGPIISIVNWGMDVDQAKFRPSCGTLQFGVGFAPLDVFAHEFTHSVNAKTAKLEYLGQSGAIDESMADVFASLVDDDDPFIGEHLVGPYVTALECDDGIGLRDLSDPPRCEQPDHFDDFVPPPSDGSPCTDNDFCAVHTNSGIPNKAAWLLMEGGLHHGFAIDPIGRPAAADLYYAVLTAGLTSQSDFFDLRFVSVAVAEAAPFLDAHDACMVKNAWAAVGIEPGQGDSDCDGVPNGSEPDNDGDGTKDGADNCPQVSNWTQQDKDGDTFGDACDPDLDGDVHPNDEDNCPHVHDTEQSDWNGDGIGDACEDTDGDQVLDADDNCVEVPNPDQANTDGDVWGDACDVDDDEDGLLDDVDPCPTTADDGTDTDGDGDGDACDNCPDDWNPTQVNCDGDSFGAACDGDGAVDAICRMIETPIAINDFVHPMDIVTLPICESCTALPERWAVSVRARAADGTPLRVVDDAGRLVGQVGPEGLTFEPEPSARFSVGREVGSFRSYFLEVGPSPVGATEVDLELVLDAGVR